LLPADPRASYLAHKDEIDQAVCIVLERGWYILGQEVASFEKEFAQYLGAEHVLGVGSGTDALHLAMRVLGIGAGDVVVTVSHTAGATVAAIEMSGAMPLLIDVDPRTYNMDPNCLEDTLNKEERLGRRNIKAVIPVHLYGQPADMPAIMDIARRYKLHVVEDCAQSHGASIHRKKTGTWGHLAAFSFYPTKNLGALGDGGALVMNDAGLAERARSLREYGWRERYVSEFAGMNTRLDELQAAILRVKLRYLEVDNTRRREIASLYDKLLVGTNIDLPQYVANTDHVYHQYVVRTPRRDALAAYLKENSVGTLVHYPVPVHLQPAYRGRVPTSDKGLKHTEQLCREILSIPIYSQMHDEQVHKVCELILRWDSVSVGKS